MLLIVHEIAEKQSWLVDLVGDQIRLTQLTRDEANYFRANRNFDGRILDNQLMVRQTEDKAIKIDQPVAGNNLTELIKQAIEIFSQANLEITAEAQVFQPDLIRVYLVVWPWT